MTDHKKQTATVVTTTTTTQAAPIRRDQSLDILTPAEEKVLRMHHGLSEGDDHELKFAVGASDETRARLAMIEAYLLETLRPQATRGNVVPEDEASLESKKKLIARLLDE